MVGGVVIEEQNRRISSCPHLIQESCLIVEQNLSVEKYIIHTTAFANVHHVSYYYFKTLMNKWYFRTDKMATDLDQSPDFSHQRNSD